MRRRSLLLVPLIALLVATSGWSQTPMPPRDAKAGAVKGTGEIRGRVTDASGKGLRRARISLDLIGGGAEGRQATSTGVDGTYSFAELPAGRYRLTAARGGYLQLQFGQRRPGEQGRPLELSEGGKLEKVDFALPRMSTIIGREDRRHLRQRGVFGDNASNTTDGTSATASSN